MRLISLIYNYVVYTYLFFITGGKIGCLLLEFSFAPDALFFDASVQHFPNCIVELAWHIL